MQLRIQGALSLFCALVLLGLLCFLATGFQVSASSEQVSSALITPDNYCIAPKVDNVLASCILTSYNPPYQNVTMEMDQLCLALAGVASAHPPGMIIPVTFSGPDLQFAGSLSYVLEIMRRKSGSLLPYVSAVFFDVSFEPGANPSPVARANATKALITAYTKLLNHPNVAGNVGLFAMADSFNVSYTSLDLDKACDGCPIALVSRYSKLQPSEVNLPANFSSIPPSVRSFYNGYTECNNTVSLTFISKVPQNEGFFPVNPKH